ncbi:MAG: macro domain-containing protein [Candidatus Paraimprobicoccus trichonymphae]|uniref:Macro domain-containing protein n=1 Tax=Candidatus Paraimprobicoccus trichonymphae TaxID=3033793 RepID=A0AA48L1D7_9FIRM|nr:MAG: macro domain-containing protein [Candidatus Paraimprobicoccus trichonymphae]
MMIDLNNRFYFRAFNLFLAAMLFQNCIIGHKKFTYLNRKENILVGTIGTVTFLTFFGLILNGVIGNNGSSIPLSDNRLKNIQSNNNIKKTAYKIGNTTLIISMDEIQSSKADCVAYAANPYLQSGGGTAGHIWNVANKDNRLKKEIDKKYPKIRNKVRCETGSVAVTSGGSMPDVKYIFHAVPPDNRKNGSYDCPGRIWENDGQLLFSLCCLNCLIEATKLECKTLAMCIFGIGIYNCPSEPAIKILIETIKNFKMNHTKNNLEEITIVTYRNEKNFRILDKTCQEEGFSKILTK